MTLLPSTQTPLIITSQSRESESDTSLWKIAVIGILGAAFSFFSVFYTNLFLSSGDTSYLGVAAAWSFVFFIVVLLAACFVKTPAVLRGMAFIWGVIPVGFLLQYLFPDTSWPLVAGFAGFAIFLMGAVGRGAKILENSVKVRFFDVAKETLPRAVTGLLILVSILIYMNAFEWGTFSPVIGRGLVSQALIVSEPALHIWFPEASFKDSVGVFFKTVAEEQLRSVRPNIIDRSAAGFQTSFTDLPVQERTLMIQEVADQYRVGLEKLAGPIDASSPMTEAVYQGLVAYVNKLSGDVKLWGGVALTVVFFGMLKTIAALLYWLIEGVAFLLFKFLLMTNFAHVAVESRSREFIVLS
jgi:hypothetical protein